jgi:hypothetical protein
MTILHGLMSQPNITMTMICWIQESREDHTKCLTENGDKLLSDEPSSWTVRTIHQGTPL